MNRDISQIRRKLKQARKVEKELGPLVSMLESLGETKELSIRERIKGESKQLRKVLKRFANWKSKRGKEIPALEAELREAEALELASSTTEEELWKRALAEFDGEPGLDPRISVFEYDFTGRPHDSKTRYYDQFAEYDRRLAKVDAEFLCLLDGATSKLASELEVPNDWQTANLILPRGLDLMTLQPTPVHGRDELIKAALFPRPLPCLVVRTEWLMSIPRLFATYFHHFGWHLLLTCLRENPDRLIQLESPHFVSKFEEPNLSEAHRVWLAANDPDQIQEIRHVDEEWDIFRHDLASRIVQANLDFFQKHVTYYAAVHETGIRR